MKNGDRILKVFWLAGMAYFYFLFFIGCEVERLAAAK